MSRLTRRRFLVTTSTLAGAMPLAKRLGWAEAAPTAPDDLKLWYTSPATQWVDALPIGNGRLGAMVFGGGAVNPPDPSALLHEEAGDAAGPVETDPARETLQLNDDTLWSGRPVDGNNLDAKNHLEAVRKAVLEEKNYHRADKLCQKMQGLFAEAYQPLGNLHLELKHAGEVTEYRRELDLATAVVRSQYKVNDVRFERSAFASAPDQAIVVRIEAGEPGGLNMAVRMDGPLTKSIANLGGERLMMTGKAPKHVAGAGHPGSETPVVLSDAAGEGMYFAVAVEAHAEGGRVTGDGGKLVIEGATACTLVVTAATGYQGFDHRPDASQAEVNERALQQLYAAGARAMPRCGSGMKRITRGCLSVFRSHWDQALERPSRRMCA